MNLDPALNRLDRIGSLIIGIGLAGYAAFGGFEFQNEWARAATIVLGLVFVIGGIGGT